MPWLCLVTHNAGPMHWRRKWYPRCRPGPALDDEASSEEEPSEGTAAYYRQRALDPVWQIGTDKAALNVLETAYILLQQKREGRVRNNYFER